MGFTSKEHVKRKSVVRECHEAILMFQPRVFKSKQSSMLITPITKPLDFLLTTGQRMLHF